MVEISIKSFQENRTHSSPSKWTLLGKEKHSSSYNVIFRYQSGYQPWFIAFYFKSLSWVVHSVLPFASWCHCHHPLSWPTKKKKKWTNKRKFELRSCKSKKATWKHKQKPKASFMPWICMQITLIGANYCSIVCFYNPFNILDTWTLSAEHKFDLDVKYILLIFEFKIVYVMFIVKHFIYTYSCILYNSMGQTLVPPTSPGPRISPHMCVYMPYASFWKEALGCVKMLWLLCSNAKRLNCIFFNILL